MSEFQAASDMDRVVWLLNRLEWQGDATHFVCPSCRQNRMHGHTPECELATLRAKYAAKAASVIDGAQERRR